MTPRESSRPADRQRSRRPSEAARREQHRKRRAESRRAEQPEETRESRRARPRPQPLSAEALEQLQRDGGAKREARRERPRRERERQRDRDKERTREKERTRNRREEYEEAPQMPDRERRQHKQKKRRVVSGAVMEEGRVRAGLRGGRPDSQETLEKDFYRKPRTKKRNKKKLWLIGGGIAIGLIIIIIVAVVVSQQNKGGGGSGSDGSGSNLDDIDRASIPTEWQNTYLDPFFWATTDGMNATFTDKMVGGLPVMGLFDDWDDSTRANEQVPPLDEAWGSYEDKPARGVNLGGWLVIEPFITPSFFEPYEEDGTNDEWVLCQQLGTGASEALENHYASFITEDVFKGIQDAGLDHVRLPFGYWAVEVYDGDPYVFRTSWRYLLRSIEWARKYGLRVNLDLHGLPGSQNGWNHSGRWGHLGWFNGTDGAANVERSSEIHDRLSQFFAQDRYKNIITHYGIANEPRMTYLDTGSVIAWTESTYRTVRSNGMDALVVFGDGFMGLDNWQGLMTGYDDMVLDVHQYVIFNVDQIDFTHQEKVEYACEGWTEQAELSMDRTRGYGPTLFAEWSQADTDCARYLTGVGTGNRWEGTFSGADGTTSSTSPGCPTKDDRCSCSSANADPGHYSDAYKAFLRMFAEAQMHSFEKGLGWWYWTWKTESSPGSTQWSYEAGLREGLLPKKAYERDFNCDAAVPDFEAEGLPEYY